MKIFEIYTQLLLYIALTLLIYVPIAGYGEPIESDNLVQVHFAEEQNGKHERWSATFHYGPIIQEDQRTFSNSQIESKDYDEHISWRHYYPDSDMDFTDEQITHEIGSHIEKTSHSPDSPPSVVQYGTQNGIPYVEHDYNFESLHFRHRLYVKDSVIYELEMWSKLDAIDQTASLWTEFADSFTAADETSIPTTEWPNADWMSKLPPHIRQLPFDELLLPGTHDSSAYVADFQNMIRDSALAHTLHYLTTISATVREYLKGWTLTQTEDIYTQLKMGNRFLDLRVAYNPENKRFYLAHLFTTIELDEALKQINLFAEKHPGEAIVITMKPDKEHHKGMQGQTKAVLDEVSSRLGPLLYGRYADETGTGHLANVTLDDLVKENKRIVFFYRPADEEANINNPLIWDGRNTYELWDNTSNVDTKLTLLKDRLDKLRTEPNDSYNFVPATLTTQLTDIFAGVMNLMLPVSSNSTNSDLEGLTKQIHQAFPEFFDKNKQDFEDVSAVMTDFPDDSFVEMIIHYNTTQNETNREEKAIKQ